MGKNIAANDIIRNYLLDGVEEKVRRDIYAKYWLPLEDKMVTSPKLDEFFLNFLIDYEQKKNNQ